MTLNEMILELGTWVTFSEKQKAKALGSEITTKNNSKFRALVNDWCAGIYDEDPNCLAEEILNLL